MAFKLKDSSGTEHEYSKDKIKVPSTTEGEYEVFTKGEVQAEKTVTITENGTTEVTPDAGYGSVKKVGLTVNVPEARLEVGYGKFTKNGTHYISPDGFDGLSYAIADVEVPENITLPAQWNYEGINFVAWDGTLVASWTLEDLQTKTELPAIPEEFAPPIRIFPGHLKGMNDGFTLIADWFNPQAEIFPAMSWNSTLEDIKANNAPAIIGMCYLSSYSTSTGTGSLSGGTNGPRLSPIIVIFENPYSEPVTFTWDLTHVTNPFYTRIPEVSSKDGSVSYLTSKEVTILPGESWAELLLLRGSTATYKATFSRFPFRIFSDDVAKYVKGFLFPGTHEKRTTSGNTYDLFQYNCGISFNVSPFLNCTNLKHIALSPLSYTVMNDIYSPFDGCYSLESVSLPLRSDTFAGGGDHNYFRVDNLFAQLTDNTRLAEYSLKMVTVPRMGNYNINDYRQTSNAMMLNTKSLYIGRNIQSLTALVDCGSGISNYTPSLSQMEIVDLTAINLVTPFSDGFSFGSHLKKIKVPASLVDQYKVATGWSDYADFIVGV